MESCNPLGFFILCINLNIWEEFTNPSSLQKPEVSQQTLLVLHKARFHI